MPDYVVGLMREVLSDRVLLIRKQKPAWQAGLLNGPGGRIENGESPQTAMVREWQEECGGWKTRESDWRFVVTLRDFRDRFAGGGAVYWLAAECRFFESDSIDGDYPGEVVNAYAIRSLAARNDVIPTVQWIIPLAFRDPTAPVLNGNNLTLAHADEPVVNVDPAPAAYRSWNGCITARDPQ